MAKRSATKKCCCDPDVFYLLTPCEDQSTKCPPDGVFVSECAWNYLSHTTIFILYGQVVVVWSENCCLFADPTTDDTPYTHAEVIALGGTIVYCKSEKDSINIEDFELEPMCDNDTCTLLVNLVS